MANPRSNQLDFRLRNQFGMLATQFLLGMAVNLIGLPDETTGLAHVASIIFLILHVLVAVGLIIGSIIIVRLAHDPQARRLARLGGASIGLAVVGGILTMSAPGSNWWSYLMAVGFIGAVISYGRLSVLASTRQK